jgi:hypothetical protein
MIDLLMMLISAFASTSIDNPKPPHPQPPTAPETPNG